MLERTPWFERTFETSLPPSLQQPMNIPGLCLFVAEHDDHHLARISELLRLLGTSWTGISI